jgi:hypothetical protein
MPVAELQSFRVSKRIKRVRGDFSRELVCTTKGFAAVVSDSPMAGGRSDCEFRLDEWMADRFASPRVSVVSDGPQNRASYRLYI